MHKTNCMQSIKNISMWEVFSSISPQMVEPDMCIVYDVKFSRAVSQVQDTCSPCYAPSLKNHIL